MKSEMSCAESADRPETVLRYGGNAYRFQGYKSGDYIYEQIKRNGSFYELETLEFVKARRLSGTYVDIGANVGNHSLFFLAETSCDALVAIEGNHFLIPIWHQNIKSNFQGAKPFQIINEFVSSEGELFFNPDLGNNIGSSFVSRVRLGEDSICIRAQTLDGMLSKWRGISLLKLDVEGHEIEVLTSAEKILRDQHPDICVEIGLTPESSLVPFLMKFKYLPLASLSNGNVYFVRFPQLAFLAVRLAARLPKPLATKGVWRLLRCFAVMFGLLPVRMFKKYVPNYGSLR
jgi:FkbM family methyltransferase